MSIRGQNVKYLLSGRQEVLFLVLFEAGTARFHLQRRRRSLLSSRLDEVSEHLRLLQQVLESVGSVGFLANREHVL